LIERDEGFPPDSAAQLMWDATVEQLKYVHALDWKARPELSSAYDPRTAFRSSFNLVVALSSAFAVATQSPPRQPAEVFGAAAAGER
jgi:hypothetical protein